MNKIKEKWNLDYNDAYYYQIQQNMQVTNSPWCDFIVYSENFIFVERIEYDHEFCKEIY